MSTCIERLCEKLTVTTIPKSLINIETTSYQFSSYSKELLMFWWMPLHFISTMRIIQYLSGSHIPRPWK